MTRIKQRGFTLIQLAIAGVIIVILLAIIFSIRPQRVIGVSTTSITVTAGQSVTFTANLLAKGWGFGAPAPVGGTLTHLSGNIVQVTPTTGTTTAAAPNQTFTVTGVAAGTGTITMNGTSAGGTHSVVTINVTVTSAT